MLEMQLIPLILLANLVSGDRIFELTAQAPSFAIHKDRLENILKSFIIKATDGSKILVDYTKRGCSNLDGNRNCNDSLSFTVDGEIIEKFDEKANLPFSLWNQANVLGTYYIYRFSITNKSQLVVQPANSSFVYAISFRVAEWVNGFGNQKFTLRTLKIETQPVLVVPGIKGEQNAIAVKGYTIVTVVPSSNDYKWNDGPISYLKPRNQYHQYPDPGCVAIQSALDCKDETIYETFAGSDPGSNPNENHRLLNGSGKYLNELVVYSRSTAATIFTKVQCNFCLIYATTAFDQHQSMNRISLWTPPYYPWIHDDVDRRAYGAGCRELLGYFPPLLIQPQFTAEIRKLQGGRIWLATLQSENPPLNPLYNASITGPIKDPIPLNGTFTQLLWCPKPDQMDKAGFMIVTKEDPNDHVRQYYLDEQTPSMAIHWLFMATFDSILIEFHVPSEVLIDWTQYGCAEPDNSTPTRPCADEVPFLLDGEKPDDGSLNQDVIPFAESKQNTAFTSGNYYTTHLNLSARPKVVLTPVLTATNVEFALAIRASYWVNVTKKLIVLPWRNPENNDGSMLYIQMKEGWIATVVANPNAYPIMPGHGPYGVLKVVGKNYGSYQEVDCPVFRQKINEEELSCPDETIYESFAGSDPGYSRNQRHFLVDGEAYELKVITRSSATTMQAKSECKYCLQFHMWDNINRTYYNLNQMSILSPTWHPWIFDEVEQTLFVTGGGLVAANIAGYTERSKVRYSADLRYVKKGIFRLQTLYTSYPPWSYNPLVGKSFERGHGFLLLMKQKPRIIELTPETPSYVIHGLRLYDFGLILLKFSSAGDLLIDYTQAGCAVNCTSGSDQAQKTPDCCEPTPFIADQADINIFQRANPTRYVSSNGTDGYLYTASAIMSTKLQQIWIQSRRMVWIDEWAVAFHLRPWVNVCTQIGLNLTMEAILPIVVFKEIVQLSEATKHLLITGLGSHDVSDNNYQILIKENLIPTIVPSMEDFRWYYYNDITDIGPSTRLTIVDQLNRNLDLCSNFTVEVTCPSGTEYSIYAGGDPGTKQTSKALLFSDVAGYSIDSRATATTILPNQTCAFCLVYELKISKEPEHLDHFSLWSSAYYPWIFDSWDHPLSEENYTGVFKIRPNETRAITVNLRRIEGGTLSLRTYSTSSCQSDSLRDDLNLTSDDIHLRPIIHSYASCVEIEWSRDDDVTGQTGFLIHIWEGSYLGTETSSVIPKPSKKVLWYFIGAGLALFMVFAIIGLIIGISWKRGFSKDRRLSNLWRERVFQHSTLFNRRLWKYKRRNEYKTQQKTDGWEVDPLFLEISKTKLGSGAFAKVYRGSLGKLPNSAAGRLRFMKSLPLPEKNGKYPVAVKMCHSGAKKDDKKEMLREIDFMLAMDSHPHVLAILGCSRDPEMPFLISELCEKGDLLSLLRHTRDPFFQDSLPDRDLLPIVWQISDALLYLVSKNIIHRDVAARNVLISSENFAKLSDFGLCRREDTLLYTGKGGILPIKWMAPESLKAFVFSEKTDVWSFGVFLYEVYTFGDSPFVTVQGTDMYDYLKNGNRLKLPDETPTKIKMLADLCWSFDAKDRPDFDSICSNLYQQLEDEAKSHEYYLSFIKNYEHRL